MVDLLALQTWLSDGVAFPGEAYRVCSYSSTGSQHQYFSKSGGLCKTTQ